MIDDEVHDGDFICTREELTRAERERAEFWDKMPAELRQEIDSLLAAGWTWNNQSFDQWFRLTHPENEEIWIHLNYPRYEIAMSVERAWQLRVENGQMNWGDAE